MITMSKTLFDARGGAAAATSVAVDADLQLRHAAQISAEDAAAWAKKRPQNGRLTALLDLPEAARLDVKAWLKALQPDLVELRTPAWSAAGMTAIGWPAGQDVLVKTLGALNAAGVATRLALHVSALTVAELTPERLAALAQATGGPLTIALRPVLGEHAPALAAVAQATAMLVRSGANVVASKLWPTCALPAGLDSEATFASERAAAHQDFTPECTGCEARAQGRCDGIAADLLKASLHGGTTWQGWQTWAEARTASVEIPEVNEAVEALELRLGLRHVWQVAVTDAGAPFPSHLHLLLGEEIPAEAASPFDIEAEKGVHRVGFVAADAATAKRAADALLGTVDADEDIANAAHRALGELLGYPTCCIESYVAALPALVADEYQGVSPLAFAVLQAARDSAAFDARLDFASPLQEVSMLQFRPCKFDCDAALARVTALEADLATSAPGRLASLQATRVNAALLFADGTEIPLKGELREGGGINNPVAHGLDTTSDSPRSRSARAAWAAIGDAVRAGVALVASHPFDGPGGVSIVNADGSLVAVEIPDAAQHVEFPRLVVFSA